jgi:gluconolactonase
MFAGSFLKRCPASAQTEHKQSLVAPGAKPEKLPEGFGFAEGPVPDDRGNVLFVDYPRNRINQWSVDNTLSVFMENVPGPVGMDIDSRGNIIVASTGKRSILSIDPKSGKQTVLADRYNGIRLNSPNDLWCDAKGGVYFTDPRFVKLPEPVEQDVEGVYYITPDRKTIIRVIDDLEKPNGVIGSSDGSLLYVNDTPADKTYVYTVNPDGTLSGKKLFAPVGYDGMAVDSRGNVYITARGLEIYTPSGEHIEHIDVPRRPTNICFGGSDGMTLFITSIPEAFTLRMRVKGRGGR